MPQPIVVTLPHKLGKAEAVRRLRASFGDAQSGGAGLFVFKNQWSGDRLDFRASMLGQNTTGTIDVAEDHVRLQVQLPWLLSLLANKAKALVEKQGKLMLKKPVKPSLREADELMGEGQAPITFLVRNIPQQFWLVHHALQKLRKLPDPPVRG
jgi:hypothetical protein